MNPSDPMMTRYCKVNLHAQVNDATRAARGVERPEIGRHLAQALSHRTDMAALRHCRWIR